MKNWSCLACLLLLCSFALAQNQRVNQNESNELRADLWEVIDLVFSQKSTETANPFDLEFGAIWTHTDGTQLNIPGFYDGEQDYVIRFAGNQPGIWTYQTYATVPDLSGKTGEVTVAAEAFEGAKGPLGIHSEKPTYFQYGNGEEAFPLAFEIDWLFALDYENAQDIPKTKQILQEISQNGFNHVVMNIYAYDVGWKIDESVPEKYFYGRPDYSVFQGTNENPEFDRLNIKFFKHLDRVIQEMHRKGIDSHLMIYVWNKKVNWPDMYSQEDNRYYDYVIKRYQAFSNIVWDVSKEALDYGRCDIPYIDERISRTRKLDAYDRLITVHDYEYNRRKPEMVDFISIQSWRTNLYDQMINAKELHPDKPVFNIEHGGYEEGPYFSFLGTYTSPQTCLERTYQCLFAGVYGSYYWQDAAWHIVIHDALAPDQPFDAPKYEYYKHLTDLFERYDFSALRPSYSKITTNGRVERDNYSNNGFVLTNDEDLFFYQIGADADRTHVILENEENRPMKVSWFNPFTGEIQTDIQEEWWAWKEMIKPWKNQFAILIIEKL
ncbi:apiosidase-like domain-containing protein [Algoriphagus namhaensis]